ncbi:MAG: hypothetical protein AAFP82_07120, partial [Bacteroidota bacterium]
MKKYSLLALVLTFSVGVSIAQYDDLYYDPDTDYDNSYYEEDYDDYDSYDYDDNYDDSSYDYFDNNEYYYTSRIRRFHRPYRGFGYFDPIYVDASYYDPFYAGAFARNGVTVLIYDDFYSYNRYRSFNNWNRWNR